MKSFIQYLHEIKSISNVPVAAKPTEPGMMSQIATGALSLLPVLAMTAISSRFGRGPAAAAGAETATKDVKSSTSKLVT